MKIDISEAKIKTRGDDYLVSIEAKEGAFFVETDEPKTNDPGAEPARFLTVKSVCQTFGVEPGTLRAAVEAEGYEIVGNRIEGPRVSRNEFGFPVPDTTEPVSATRSSSGEPVPERTQDPNYAELAQALGVSYDEAVCMAMDAVHLTQFLGIVAKRAAYMVGKALVKEYGTTETDIRKALRWALANDPYQKTALSLAELVADKQRQYGDSAGRTGQILRVLYPDGIRPEEYARTALITRVLDKISRLATNKIDLGGEDPWRDIAGYALLAVEKGL